MTTGAEQSRATAERSDAADADARYAAEVARNYRWNLGAHLLYGLLGTTGWRLITAPTFVPEYMFRLGGSNVAVGLLLFAGGIGRFLSPLAGAAYVAHRPLVKRTAIVIGSGMRFQVLGMALAALFLPARANYIAFFVLYCAFSVLNGLQTVVYGVLMAKVIPLARRGRFIGLRDFAGGATAAGVAWLAARVLRDMAFPASYGVTYLVAFAFTSLGLVCFAAIREPRAPVLGVPRSFTATVRGVPRLLARDRRFAWYCVARGIGALALMAAPYFIIAAGRFLPHDPGNTGRLSVAYFSANTLANLLWGQLADRVGFRGVFLAAAAVWLAALGVALSAPSTLAAVTALFVLVGCGQGGMQMASMNLVYEFGDGAGLGVRLAVVNTLGELMAAIAPLAGGVIADRWSYEALYGVAIACTLAAAATMYARVRPAIPRSAPAC
jgi:predicted MFS family arabinose efflux permease